MHEPRVTAWGGCPGDGTEMFGNTSYMHIASPALEKADGYTIGCPPVLSLLCDVLYHSLKHFTLIFPYASYEDGVVVRSES